jgi:hypothetical protein
MDYEVYHDESKEAGYWHGLLFVPAYYRTEVVRLLESIRNDAGYRERVMLSFKGLDSYGPKFKALSSSLQLFRQLTRRVIKASDPGAIRSRNRQYEEGNNCRTAFTEIVRVQRPYDVKFALLRERDAHRKMSFYSDFGSKIETTFRFALKGGCHFMFDEKRAITLKKIYFDGHGHYGQRGQ